MEWNFQKIEYFLRMTEEKSLSEAARKMYFTPQALNKNLRQLEAELGVKLINRERGNIGNGEGMKLTLAGEKLKEYFMPCYHEYHEAIGRMENYLAHQKRKLRIAYFKGIQKNELLMPLFFYLSESEEFESIELLSGEWESILKWVADGVCDVGVTGIPGQEWKHEGICHIPIWRVPVVILISDKHVWAGKDCITAADMEQETMVILRWNEELKRDNFWNHVRVKGHRIVDDLDSMYAEIKTGKYFGVMTSVFEGDYDPSFIKMELPPEYAFTMDFSIVYQEGNYFERVLEKIEKDQKKIWRHGKTNM